MNAYVAAFLRDLTCAAAAVLISLAVSMSFLQSTATAPGAHAPIVNARAVDT